MATFPVPRINSDREVLQRRISAVAWGLLFVWVGAASLAHLGWGYGLLGVGAIVLGAQVARRFVVGLKLELFSTAVGLLFLLGGIWEQFSVQVELVPILCIAAGAVLILSSFTSRPAR